LNAIKEKFIVFIARFLGELLIEFSFPFCEALDHWLFAPLRTILGALFCGSRARAPLKRFHPSQ
jgi:hypothetical protein